MAKFEYMERAFSSELRPRARLVLQVLVLHCNKEGEWIHYQAGTV